MEKSMALLEIGQRIRVRSLIWEIVDIHFLDDGTKVLEVIGLEEPMKGKKMLFLSNLEKIEILSTSDLSFRVVHRDSFDSWKYFVNAMRFQALPPPNCTLVPFHSRIEIEPYQLIPLLRCLTNSSTPPRMLIADDVGLGKTIEAGLIIADQVHRKKANKILIITPPALQEQWKEELQRKFFLKFEIFDSDRLRREILPQIPVGINPWEAFPRIITSMDFMKRLEILRQVERIKWDLVIIDEAHYMAHEGLIKTQRSRLGEKIARKTKGLLLLTATPSLGSMKRFLSLMYLIDPSFTDGTSLNSRKLRQHFVRRLKHHVHSPFLFSEDEDALSFHPAPFTFSHAERRLIKLIFDYLTSIYLKASNLDASYQSVAMAMVMLKKRALSSWKALERALDLRSRYLDDVHYPMKSALRRHYMDGMMLTEAQVERLERDALVTTLDTSHSSLTLEEEREQLINLRDAIRDDVLQGVDCKIEALLELLENMAHSGRKVIVFTEYRDTLSYLIDQLVKSGYNLREISWLHGMMNSRRRQEMENKFRQNHCLILVATDSASEGFNFQRHGHQLVHFDLPWTPQRIIQRVGRIDRWGQTHPVQIHALIPKDIEEVEYLISLQQRIIAQRKKKGSFSTSLGYFKHDEFVKLMMMCSSDSRVRDRAQVEQIIHSLMSRELDKELPVELLGHSPEEEQAVSQLLSRSTSWYPSETDLQELVMHLVEVKGGKVTDRSTEEFLISIPREFQQSDLVPSSYQAVTFCQKKAFENEKLEFISVFHPLAKQILNEFRKMSYLPTDEYRINWKIINQPPKSLNDSESCFIFIFQLKEVHFQEKNMAIPDVGSLLLVVVSQKKTGAQVIINQPEALNILNHVLIAPEIQGDHDSLLAFFENNWNQALTLARQEILSMLKRERVEIPSQSLTPIAMAFILFRW